MIYFAILFFLIVLAVIYDFGGATFGRGFWYFVVFLILVLLSGLRYRVGGDTLLYIVRHERMPDLNQLINRNFAFPKLQPLWLVFSAVAKSISKEFYVLQFMHAIFINFFIFHFIKKFTKHTFLGILLYYIGYYFYFNFEILRESMAIVVFLYALSFLINKKWVPYFICAIITFQFHFSGIVLFIIPLLMKIKVSFLRATFLFFIGVILNSVFASLVFKVNLLGGFMSNAKSYADYTPSLIGFVSLYLLYIIYPYIIKYLAEKNIKRDIKLFPFLNIYLLIGASTAIFFIFFRFLNYLTPIFFIVVAELIMGVYQNQVDTYKKYIVSAFILIFTTVISLSPYFEDTSDIVANSRWYHHWYPYTTIFNKQEYPKREKLIFDKNNF